MTLSENWRQRWTEVFGIDLRTLALFRVALASVLLFDLTRRLLFDLTAFHTDSGIVPRDWAIQSEGALRFSLYFANGDAWFAALMLLVTILAALALWWGYRARLAAVTLFVLVGSLQSRNPVILIGGDLLIMSLLFWAMFLPLGARWSVDAALSRNATPQDNRYVSWGTAALLIQVMSVYFFSAILKDGADWWPNGLAVYYTMQLDRFATPLGKLLGEFPLLMQGMSYFVYFLEWLGPILVFLPLWLWLLRTARFTVMLLLMGMHVGFILCMEIGHFPYTSLASLTTFLGGWAWDWAERRRDRGHAIRIYYDRDCGFCRKMCQLLETFLVLPRATIEPAQNFARSKALLEANYSWVVIDHEDRAHIKWSAFVALLRHSLLFGWLYRLAALRIWERPGNATYDFVGRHRGAFGRVSAALLPEREVRFEPSRLLQKLAAGVVALMMALVLSWNLTTIKLLPDRTFDALAPAFRVLRIDQLWNMFAPYPSRADGWVVFPGTLEDGSEVDVLRPGRALSWDKPRYTSQTHRNIRWHTYQWRIWEQDHAGHRLHYGRYLCRDWNQRAEVGKRLVKFDMNWVQELSLPPGRTPKVERRVGWRHECVSQPAPAEEPVGIERSD